MVVFLLVVPQILFVGEFVFFASVACRLAICYVFVRWCVPFLDFVDCSVCCLLCV